MALPAGLAAWAWLAPLGQGLPLPPWELGPPVAALGLALWIWAVATFIRRTGKLPLNADPPARAVTAGPYALVGDPIYVGFGLAVLGCAAWAQSPAGVWLVAPVAAASMLALVVGYEGQRRPVRDLPPLVRWPVAPRLRARCNGGLAAVVVGTVLFAGAPWPGWGPAAAITLGLVLFGAAAPGLHGLAVALATRIANSWSALRIGPVRIINYVPIAALAAGGGVLAFGVVTPDAPAGVAGLIAAAVLLGGGTWGKLLESTGRLARPFGYFGAFLGGVAGVVGAGLVWGRPLLAIGAGLAFAATWIQAVGRLRCLVQGCCFGRPMPHGAGICYRRAESRAVALAGLGGRTLYPTPLFSIYANLLSGALILRLYLANQGAAAILAAYLIVAGLSRFAEEGFRGEADVRRYLGLTLYQWLSVGQLLAGIGFSLAASPPLAAPDLPGSTDWAVAAVAALAFAVAMGVDFPDLDLPLARLTPSPRDETSPSRR